jgi:hypothetical protein
MLMNEPLNKPIDLLLRFITLTKQFPKVSLRKKLRKTWLPLIRLIKFYLTLS